KVREAEPAVANLGEAAILAESNALGAGKEFTGELTRSLLGIEAAGEGAVVLAESLDIIGIEHDIGIDPHQFGEPFGNGIGSHLIACGVDRGVAAHSPDGMPAPLQLAQGFFATRIDGRPNGYENRTR